jgi:hypothetical protein
MRGFCTVLMAVLLMGLGAVSSARAQQSPSQAPNMILQPLTTDDAGSVVAPPAQLGHNQILFTVKSGYPKPVDIAFYSSNRRFAWPAKDRVYTVGDSETHYYVLSCNRGEMICYGAGVRDDYRTYWGSGIGNKQRCKNCCSICNGTPTKEIVLNK